MASAGFTYGGFGGGPPPASTAPSGPSAQQQRWNAQAEEDKRKLEEYNAAQSAAPRPSSGGASSGGGASSMSSSSGDATPYGAAGESAGALQKYGTEMLDPNSPESQRWMEELRENIGRSTEAGQRAAGYMAAQSGLGAGASPEMLEMQQNLGVSGREAEGQAASDFMLKAPQMGMSALGTALGGQTQMRSQDLSARLGEMGLTQSGEQSNAAMEMQQRNLDLERDRMEQERYLRELMLEYGGY